MKVAVVGAGGIGCVFGGRLAAAGHEVWLVVGRSKPSMLQDMERGRPTEIDAINGAIVREGARLGTPTPYNQALLLLVKARHEVSERPA